MKVFLIIFVLISFSLLSNEDSQYAKTIRETAKSMGYQLTEEELEACGLVEVGGRDVLISDEKDVVNNTVGN